MSIQTELTRLTNAKAAIQTAIEGKGVTVPSGTLLDGMAALIESIEAGGGGNASVFGSITPASNGPITITHNFGDGYNTDKKVKGKTTILIVAAAEKNISAGVYSICSVGKTYSESSGTIVNSQSKSYTRWGNGYIHTTAPSITAATSESFTINNSNASYPFAAGTTYYYAVWDNGNWNG